MRRHACAMCLWGEGQRTTYRRCFSCSTMWIPSSNLMLSDLNILKIFSICKNSKCVLNLLPIWLLYIYFGLKSWSALCKEYQWTFSSIQHAWLFRRKRRNLAEKTRTSEYLGVQNYSLLFVCFYKKSGNTTLKIPIQFQALGGILHKNI